VSYCSIILHPEKIVKTKRNVNVMLIIMLLPSMQFLDVLLWFIIIFIYLFFHSENHNLSPEEKAALIASTKSPISFLSKLGQSIAISRKRNPKVVKFLFDPA